MITNQMMLSLAYSFLLLMPKNSPMGYRPSMICPLPTLSSPALFIVYFPSPTLASDCYLNLTSMEPWCFRFPGTCNHPRTSPSCSGQFSPNHLSICVGCVCDCPVWRVLTVTLQPPCFFITFILCHHVKFPWIVGWIVSPKFMLKS